MSIKRENVRNYWLEKLLCISEPVLSSLSQDKLKKNMPVECVEGTESERMNYTYLEAFGRTLAGIAPWLENNKINKEEEQKRLIYAKMAREAIDVATNIDSADFMNFESGVQPVVNSAFLAHAILRAKNELWNKLDDRVKENLVKCLKATRIIKPYYNNWLLFSAMIETALYIMGEKCDYMRIDYALKEHMLWYQGDGIYGDGPQFHYDYYNSFVIQPMLVDIINTIGEEYEDWKHIKPNIMESASRYAEIQERLISPEGTFPPIGRSLAYRFGAFQHLAQMVLIKNLPSGIYPSQVRCALTLVIDRMINMPNTFDANGWLKIGFCGSQPDIGEQYISTGSLYLCSTVFLPLGLDEDDEFWVEEDREWTSLKIWSGKNCKCDHAISFKL